MAKKDTDDDNVVNLLTAGHFGNQKINTPDAGDPVTESMTVLTLDELTEYSGNPRKARNAEYDALKASYLQTGAFKTLLVVTRRPGEELYFPEAGGNTRLRILKELWEEFQNEKYYRVNCKIVPWKGDTQVLIDHLSENDNRSDYIFIDRAKGICRIFDEMSGQHMEEHGEPLSQRAFIKKMLDSGYSKLSKTQFLRFQYAVDLYEYIPLALDGGMHVRAIVRLQDNLNDLKSFIRAACSGNPDVIKGFDEQWKWELDKLDNPDGIDLEKLPGLIFESLAPEAMQSAPDLELDEIPARLMYLWRDWSADKSLEVSLRHGSASRKEKYNPTRSGPARHFGSEEAEKEFGEHYSDHSGSRDTAAPGGHGIDADASSGSRTFHPDRPPAGPSNPEGSPPPTSSRPESENDGPAKIQQRLYEENFANARIFGQPWGIDHLIHSLGGVTGFWLDIPDRRLEGYAITAWWLLWDLFLIAGDRNTPNFIPVLIERKEVTGSLLEKNWIDVANGKASLSLERIESFPPDRRNAEILQAFRHLVESGIQRVTNQTNFLTHIDQPAYDAFLAIIGNVRKLKSLVR